MPWGTPDLTILHSDVDPLTGDLRFSVINIDEEEEWT